MHYWEIRFDLFFLASASVPDLEIGVDLLFPGAVYLWIFVVDEKTFRQMESDIFWALSIYQVLYEISNRYYPQRKLVLCPK